MLALLTAFIAVTFSSCSLLKNALADGVEELRERKTLDSLSYEVGQNLSKGLSDELLNDSTKIKLNALVNALNDSLGMLSTTLRDSLLVKDAYDAWLDQLLDSLTNRAGILREELLGARTQELIKKLQVNIRDPKTRQYLSDLRDELIGEETRLRLALMRNELLGQQTRMQLDSLQDILLSTKTQAGLDSMVNGIVQPIIKQIDESLGSKLKLTQKYAGELLLGVLAIAIIIIWWIWHKRKKYLNLVKVLTAQIHEIPEQTAYDELTKRIQKDAISTSMEPLLRKILKSQGLLN